MKNVLFSIAILRFVLLSLFSLMACSSICQSELRLDSVLSYWIGNNEEMYYHNKWIHGYDDSGNQISTTRFLYENHEDIWTKAMRINRLFNENGKIIEKFEEDYFGRSPLYPVKIRYNEDEQVSCIMLYNWRYDENIPWEFLEFHCREYDDKGRIIHELITDCDTSKYYPNWVIDHSWYYELTDSSYTVTQYSESWDYFNDDTIKRSQKLCYWYEDSIWTKIGYDRGVNYQITREFNDYGVVAEETVLRFDTELGWQVQTWDLSIRFGPVDIEAYINETGRSYWGYQYANELVFEPKYYQDGKNVRTRKWVYSFDEYENMLSRLEYHNIDHNTDDWKRYEKHEFEYEDSVLVSHTIFKLTYKGDWRLDHSYEYDIHSNLISEFDGHIRTDYYYSIISTGVIFDDDHNLNISVYPNPTTDILYLTGISQPTMVEVFSMQGQLMKSSIINRQSSMSIGELPNGIYILRISHQGRTEIKRIIKY